MLDLLPADLALAILREWLLGCGEPSQARPLASDFSPARIAVLSNLDVAFCNHARRDWMFSLIRKLSPRQLRVTSHNQFAWIHSRGLAVQAVEIDIGMLAEFAHIESIAPLPSVVSIALTNQHKCVLTAPLGEFVALYPNLAEVDALACSPVSESTVVQLLEISSPLRSLLLPSDKRRRQCPESCITLLAKFAPSLERIHCSHLTDEQLVTLSHSLHNLKTVAVIIDRVTSSNSLLCLVQANPQLEYFYCDYDPTLQLPRRCPIDDNFVTQLAALCPKLHSLFLPTCCSTYRSILTLLERCFSLHRAFCGDVELDVTHAHGQRQSCRLTLGEAISLEEAKTILASLPIPLSAFQFGRNINSLSADAALLRLIAQQSSGMLSILNLNVDSRVPCQEVEALLSQCPRLSHLYITVLYPRLQHEDYLDLFPAQSDASVWVELSPSTVEMHPSLSSSPCPTQGLSLLGPCCKQLREMAIRDKHLTDQRAAEILQACPACPLVEISFQGCSLLTGRTAARVLELFPQLWVLDMSDTGMTRRERCLLGKPNRSKVHIDPC